VVNVILSEVEPIRGDSYETVGYTTCDFCFQNATDELNWPCDWSQVRRFYELLGEAGCIVCENCLPALLAGEHEPEPPCS
jgi:hypothetical protein